MASCVLETISQEVKDAKYYSLIVDSTPDCSHTHQLAVVLRYVSLMEAEPKERLFKLLPRVRHSSDQLEEALLKCLTELGLEIKNCMGQSYDNASNMSGPYKGLQARIKGYNKFSDYVPCAAPVSYTHLDVYKRQTIYWIPRKIIR